MGKKATETAKLPESYKHSIRVAKHVCKIHTLDKSGHPVCVYCGSEMDL